MTNEPQLILSPLKAARRDKILTSAEHLFVRNGFRAVTMESVAEAVGMSKVTVYGYFKDKDAVFAGVAAQLAMRLWRAVETALNLPGDPAERILAALVNKHEIVFQVVRASGFSGELFAAKNQHVATRFQTLDSDIEAAMAKVLEAAGYSDALAKSTARLLFGAATGIANHAATSAEMKQSLKRLVFAVLAPGAG